jgi:hypothetical protein
MSAPHLFLRLFRTILNGFPLFLVLLAFDPNFRPARAMNPPPAATNEAQTAAATDLAPSRPADAGTVYAGSPLAGLQLDNATSAAMIAAENAALTAPQYLVDLPLIVR